MGIRLLDQAEARADVERVAVPTLELAVEELVAVGWGEDDFARVVQEITANWPVCVPRRAA